MPDNVSHDNTTEFVQDTTEFVSELYSNAETEGAIFGQLMLHILL